MYRPDTFRREWDKFIRNKWDAALIAQVETRGLIDADALRYLERRYYQGEPLLEKERYRLLYLLVNYLEHGEFRTATVRQLASLVKTSPSNIERLFEGRHRLTTHMIRAMLRLLLLIGLRPEQINAPCAVVLAGDRPLMIADDGARYPGQHGSVIAALIGGQAPLSVMRYVERWLDEAF